MLKQFLFEEEGQTLIEYGLLLSLIAMAVIAMVTVFGNKIKNQFKFAGNQLPNN